MHISYIFNDIYKIRMYLMTNDDIQNTMKYNTEFSDNSKTIENVVNIRLDFILNNI